MVALGPLSTRTYVVGVSLLAASFVIVFLDARALGNLHNGDSSNLVQGARYALQCLGNGDLVGCGHLGDSRQTEVFPYPLLQYLPAGLLAGLGVSDGHVLEALGILSFIALAAALLVAFVTFRDRPRHAALALLALVGTSALYQATSAFGESLVASLVVLAVCAGIRRSPTAIFVLVFTASLGKETLAPFVVALVLICVHSPAVAGARQRRLTVVTVTAGIFAMALNATFNVFRFGSPRNLLYLDPQLHTPGVFRKLEFFSAIIASPSSGVLWFWPFFSAITVSATAIGVHRVWTRRKTPGAYVPVLAVTCTMLLWFAGLSGWYSPFGWIAYGPRLEVPLLAGLAVAYVHTVGDSIIDGAQRSRTARFLGVAALLAGSLQLFAPWRWSDAVGQLIAGRESCPDMTALDIYGAPAQFYRCAAQVMWRIRPSVFDDLVEIGLTWSCVAWLAGLAGCLLLWRFITIPSPCRARD